MLAWSRFALILGLLLTETAASAAPRLYTGVVGALSSKRCRAYLHVSDTALSPPLAVSLQGTGIYTTGSTERLDPSLKRLVRRGQLAVVTIDKPGIEPSPERPGVARVTDGDYNRYTQEDLLACAYHAIGWARDNSPTRLGSTLYFSGHSEGSQVLTRLYRYLLQKEPALAANVKMLVLSGLPMDDWRQMLDGQLTARNRGRFWDGFMGRNDRVLRSFGGLSFYYLSHVFSQEPLRQTLESLWATNVQAAVRIFQGLLDRNTPAKSVQAFEEANQARLARGEAALDLKVRYYQAGHALNARAIDDIAADLEQDLSTLALVDTQQRVRL